MLRLIRASLYAYKIVISFIGNISKLYDNDPFDVIDKPNIILSYYFDTDKDNCYFRTKSSLK